MELGISKKNFIAGSSFISILIPDYKFLITYFCPHAIILPPATV